MNFRPQRIGGGTAYHDGSTEEGPIRHDGKHVRGELGPNHGW